MPSWDWDEEADSEGVVHQSVANTDHNDATKLKQGYDYQNFSEITPTPVACWPLHEDSGTTANDVAGTNDGTYSGPTLGQEGILGTTAPSFDGSDDYIDIPNNISGLDFSGSAAWSVFFWFYDADKSYSELLYKPNRYEWRIRHNEDGNNQITLINFDGSFVNRRQSSATTTVGEFNSIGVSYDGAGGVTMFVNGSDESFTIQTDPEFSSDDAAIMFDRTNSLYGLGRLAHYNLYSADVSAAQYQTLYDVVRNSGDWLGDGKLL